MATRLPVLLSKSARNALPYIESAVARKLTLSAMQAELSALGLGVRRQDLSAARNYVSGTVSAGDTLRFTRKDRRPDLSRVPEAKTRILRGLSVIVEVRGFDTATGEATTRYLTISQSERMTIQEMEDQAMEWAADQDHYHGFDPRSAVITKAVKAGALGTLL